MAFLISFNFSPHYCVLLSKVSTGKKLTTFERAGEPQPLIIIIKLRQVWVVKMNQPLIINKTKAILGG